MPPAWDSVAYGSAQALGYVDAGHQSLTPQRGATVLSSYWALPESQRPALLQDDWRQWAGRVLAELGQLHPDLNERVQRVDIARWGHAMSIPVPGRRRFGGPGRAAAGSGTRAVCPQRSGGLFGVRGGVHARP